jgi:hypothetical protein
MPNGTSIDPTTSSARAVTMPYQHVRELNGIISTLIMRPAHPLEDEESRLSFGQASDAYLAAHGYTLNALYQIHTVVRTSRNAHDFAGFLNRRGMALTEIVYLWNLIHSEDDY